MKHETIKEAALTTVICLIPMVAGICLYGKLPEEIPTKWYTDGTVGQFADKNMTVFGLPGLMAAVNLLVHFFLNTDPKKQRMSVIMKRISKWICPVLGLICGGAGIAWGLGYEMPVNTVVPLLLGILFTVIGNYLPKCKQNYTMGIKLPWTLHSEDNWNKTHHLAGYLWIFAGVLLIAAAFLQWYIPQAVHIITIVIIIAMVLTPAVYSYLLYRKGI